MITAKDAVKLTHDANEEEVVTHCLNLCDRVILEATRLKQSNAFLYHPSWHHSILTEVMKELQSRGFVVNNQFHVSVPLLNISWDYLLKKETWSA